MIGRISRSKETCPPDWARDGAETAATSIMGVRVYRANRRERLRMAVNLRRILTLRHQPCKVHETRSIESMKSLMAGASSLANGPFPCFVEQARNASGKRQAANGTRYPNTIHPQTNEPSKNESQIRVQQDPVPHSARRVSVGSVRSARSTAGRVATRAVSPRAHAGSAIISASVAFAW